MLTKSDFDQCGACLALKAEDHTRLGHGHQWCVGDPIIDWRYPKGRVTTSVKGFVDHGDHVVAVHPMPPVDRRLL